MEQADSRRIVLSVLAIALLLVAIVGISYAVFVFTSNSKKENVINTGAISMSYVEGITNVISIKNALPTIDDVGKQQQEYFDFQLSAKISGNAKINYQVIAKNITNEFENGLPKIPVQRQLNANQIKIYLEKEDGSQYETVLKPTIFSTLPNFLEEDDTNKVLYTGSFYNDGIDTQQQTDKFILRMWLDSNAEIDEISRTFKIKVDVKAIME